MTRTGWVASLCVVLCAAWSGLLFAPVFGLVALLVPVCVPATVALVAALASSRGEYLPDWRPLVVIVAGLLAVVATVLPHTTVVGVPTGRTVLALLDGVSGSWRATLQSTWPARPDAELVLFVPLLVLLAVVLGIELVHRMVSPLWSLLPSFAVLVLSQLFFPLDPAPALLAACGYVGVAGGLLAVVHNQEEEGRRPAFAALLGPGAAALVCAVLAGLAAPPAVSEYSLRDDQPVPLEQRRVESPLGRLADWQAQPDLPLFRVHGEPPVDRWPLVVLDTFDGVNWLAGNEYRRLGSGVPPPEEIRGPVSLREGRITVPDAETFGGPWLPSQPAPAAVRGPRVLVDQQRGTLLRVDDPDATSYELAWWEPRIGSLRDAAVDTAAPGGLAPIGAVPAGVTELVDDAVGGLRPTFQTALVLERWMQENYRLASGTDIPTGHSWPQLSEFLLDTKRGTSEQFATSYVALARAAGIPARLVVGFRAPRDDDGVVRGRDVLAWPQVAVRGAGWVPLDPTGDVEQADASESDGAAAAADRAREQLPPAQELRPPPVAPPEAPPADRQEDAAVPWAALGSVAMVLALVWLGGAPLWRLLRSWRRRRRGVTGAMDEVRDLLRAHRVPITAGMTARDVAAVASGRVDQTTVDGLVELAVVMDLTLWAPAGHAGAEAVERAWGAVRTVRRGLARRGWWTWLRATWRPLTAW